MKPNAEIFVQWSDALAEALRDHQLGLLAIWKANEPGWEVSALVRSDADPEQVEQFVGWVKAALEQLNDTGDPHGNGWFRSEHRNDRWYMTCVLRNLPSPD